MTCASCGREGGHGTTGLSRCPYEPGAGAVVKTDTIDFWAENAWREPRHFDSQSQYEKALAADGMMLKPLKPKGVSPVAPETLQWAARRLAAREASTPMTTRVLDETFRIRAEED